MLVRCDQCKRELPPSAFLRKRRKKGDCSCNKKKQKCNECVGLNISIDSDASAHDGGGQ